jgi:hypothetical protein
MNIDYFFISKPRCASTHIYEGLTKWNDEIDGNKKYYHYTAKKMKSIFKDYDKKISFAVVRHPYDLVLSWYNEHKKDRYDDKTKNFYNITFDEWINKGCPTHWTNLNFNPLNQYLWLYENNKLIVSDIIKLENYDHDINLIFNKIKKFLKNDITLTSLKNTRKNDSKNNIILTPSQKNIIFELFKKDFEYFNYSP